MSGRLLHDGAELELAAWRAVAVALAAELADLGADPLASAVLAYNHARNGRYTEALQETSS